MDVPARELLEKGAKTERQKVLIWQAGKHKMGKKLLGFAETLVVPPTGST